SICAHPCARRAASSNSRERSTSACAASRRCTASSNVICPSGESKPAGTSLASTSARLLGGGQSGLRTSNLSPSCFHHRDMGMPPSSILAPRGCATPVLPLGHPGVDDSGCRAASQVLRAASLERAHTITTPTDNYDHDREQRRRVPL